MTSTDSSLSVIRQSSVSVCGIYVAQHGSYDQRQQSFSTARLYNASGVGVAVPWAKYRKNIFLYNHHNGIDKQKQEKEITKKKVSIH